MTDKILYRAVASEFAWAPSEDGYRYLETRLVPYNMPTKVTDIINGQLDSYVEEIAPEAFARQVHAAHPQSLARVRFFDSHPMTDGSSRLGWATALRADEAWLYGTFKLLPSRIGDVEAMLEGGIHDVSIGFEPLAGGTMVRSDGSRQRIRARLDHVALEPEGAYPGAEVLAMRAEAEADEQAIHDQERIEAVDLDTWLKEAEERQAEFLARARGIH